LLDAKIVEQRFRESESILDTQLARIRDGYLQAGYEIIDQSNRSGFDKSGFPFYKWEHVIRRPAARRAPRGTLQEVARLEGGVPLQGWTRKASGVSLTALRH
jgi:hypothetical protein